MLIRPSPPPRRQLLDSSVRTQPNPSPFELTSEFAYINDYSTAETIEMPPPPLLLPLPLTFPPRMPHFQIATQLSPDYECTDCEHITSGAESSIEKKNKCMRSDELEHCCARQCCSRRSARVVKWEDEEAALKSAHPSRPGSVAPPSPILKTGNTPPPLRPAAQRTLPVAPANNFTPITRRRWSRSFGMVSTRNLNFASPGPQGPERRQSFAGIALANSDTQRSRTKSRWQRGS